VQRPRGSSGRLADLKRPGHPGLPLVDDTDAHRRRHHSVYSCGALGARDARWNLQLRWKADLHQGPVQRRPTRVPARQVAPCTTEIHLSWLRGRVAQPANPTAQPTNFT